MTASGEDDLQLPLEERDELRRESAQWWIAYARSQLPGGTRPHTARAPCPACGITEAVLVPKGGQSTVRCQRCGRSLYNAPKTETGEAPRTAATVRQGVTAGQQARILDRDRGRCVLCGRSGADVPLTIGHLLSVHDGVALGATEAELHDDANLAAMCEACNLGLGERSVSLATYARIMLHLLRSEVGRRTGAPPATPTTTTAAAAATAEVPVTGGSPGADATAPCGGGTAGAG